MQINKTQDMKHPLLVALLLTVLPAMGQTDNILLNEFNTTHQMTPFDKIKKVDYEAAFDAGIKQQREQINTMLMQRSMPTFENTILALENAGATLTRVSNVFFVLLSSEGDDEMMAISQRVTPKLTELGTEISLNEKLWQRVKYVYDQRDKLNLTAEEMQLLCDTYDSFVRSGANLEGADREKYRQITSELSQLTLTFGQNALKEQNQTFMWLTKDDLDGLPESAITAYAEAAEKKGRSGEYLVTMSYPHTSAFMKYSSRADLRKKLSTLRSSMNTKGEWDNTEIAKKIADLRSQLGRLMGASNYAEFSLKKTMAETPANVYNLLDQLRDAYMPAWEKELKELTEYASKLEGKKVTLNSWDYSYYANKLKNEKYSVDDEALRPYFELSNVVKGVFGLATKLYGLQFTENPNIIVYNPEVKGYDVTDANGQYIGIIYTDFFPRDTKRSGAWMTTFLPQRIKDNGENQRPHVVVTMNFTRPTADTPALLTFGEVETFLHEFGHALHGLLANTRFASMSGTNVYRDFVELPSQFNENYLVQKEFLDGFARHYKTGEPMPEELLNSVIASSQFGAAYSCIRQLGFGYLDMAWHTITAPVTDFWAFEKEALKSVEIFPEIEGTSTSAQFNHIFSGGYAAGYYSYKWSEVLDADAFAAFQEKGIFDQETAKSFRENILSKGGTVHPMTLYKAFRGSEPSIKPLLARDGIAIPKAKKGKKGKK